MEAQVETQPHSTTAGHRPVHRALCSLLAACLLVTATCGPLAGCSTERSLVADPDQDPMWYTLRGLTAHRSPVVSYPAQFGALFGAIVGIPVALVLLPITWPLSLLGTEADRERLPMLPVVAMATVFTNFFGGPMWLLFGWWWPDAWAKTPDPVGS